MLPSTPHSFPTLCRKSLAAYFVVQFVGIDMKVAYLLNLSTTTYMLPYPSDFGRQEMKSKIMFSHGRCGMGSGSNNPPGCW
ncbi:hypothetical protein MA16_Dca006578 [Dendrobium catenatum]|uniref:Uncharacterized protein n=1 Tax=Dendrobium catenatum TaxID=906689 RepID=A0A2I0XGY1_9ASPA|nr:hypothetical protein MA16_Dca006578 [Dendrobium catenatum]